LGIISSHAFRLLDLRVDDVVEEFCVSAVQNDQLVSEPLVVHVHLPDINHFVSVWLDSLRNSHFEFLEQT